MTVQFSLLLYSLGGLQGADLEMFEKWKKAGGSLCSARKKARGICPVHHHLAFLLELSPVVGKIMAPKDVQFWPIETHLEF